MMVGVGVDGICIGNSYLLALLYTCHCHLRYTRAICFQQASKQGRQVWCTLNKLECVSLAAIKPSFATQVVLSGGTFGILLNFYDYMYDMLWQIF